jgi:hypothetical protein
VVKIVCASFAFIARLFSAIFSFSFLIFPVNNRLIRKITFARPNAGRHEHWGQSHRMTKKKKCSAAADNAAPQRHGSAVRRDCQKDAAKNPDAYESWARFCLKNPDALMAKAAAIATGQAVKRAKPLDDTSLLILQILERQAAFGF